MEPLARASNSGAWSGARCRNTRGNGVSGRRNGIYLCRDETESHLAVSGVPQLFEGLFYCSSDVPQDDDDRADPERISVNPPEAVTREKTKPVKCRVTKRSRGASKTLKGRSYPDEQRSNCKVGGCS